MNILNKLQPLNKGILLVTILITAALTACSTVQPPSTTPPGTIAAAPSTTPASTTTAPSVTKPPPVTTPPAGTTTSPASPSPKPTLTTPPAPSQTPWPTSFYTPTAAPYKPTGALAELFQYTLNLINQDRQAAGLNPVVLNYNAAAQKHAQDMFDNFYLAHWGTDGLKPYMRFTNEGGVNYEWENSAYAGWFNKSENPANYAAMDVKQEIKSLHDAMMAEVPPDDGHKQNILFKWHKKVSLGIVHDTKRLALVHQFEGDYVAFYQPPSLSGNVLSLSGQVTLPGATLNNVSIAFDPTPQAIAPDVLNNSQNPNYHRYDLGQKICSILPPPPPGQIYSSLPGDAIIATKWDYTASGQFSIQADISPALKGKGVYTVVMVAVMGSDSLNMTKYSIYMK